MCARAFRFLPPPATPPHPLPSSPCPPSPELCLSRPSDTVLLLRLLFEEHALQQQQAAQEAESSDTTPSENLAALAEGVARRRAARASRPLTVGEIAENWDLIRERCLMKWTGEEMKKEKEERRREKLRGGGGGGVGGQEAAGGGRGGGAGGQAAGESVGEHELRWEIGADGDPEEGTLHLLDRAVVAAHYDRLTHGGIEAYTRALAYEGEVAEATQRLMLAGTSAVTTRGEGQGEGEGATSPMAEGVDTEITVVVHSDSALSDNTLRALVDQVGQGQGLKRALPYHDLTPS